MESLTELMSKVKISDLSEPPFVPYEGIQGIWVKSLEYPTNSKTFGFYRCNYCEKTWMSAHSKRSFKQGCKSCNRYFYPTHLWKN